MSPLTNRSIQCFFDNSILICIICSRSLEYKKGQHSIHIYIYIFQVYVYFADLPATRIKQKENMMYAELDLFFFIYSFLKEYAVKK